MTTVPSIEYLTPERVVELREVLLPLFQQSCDGNEISKENLTPEDILALAVTGEAVVFLGCEDDEPTCVLAIQFFIEGTRKGADVLALAGKGLVTFKQHYWQSILDWLKANQIKYLDAYVDGRRAKMYQSRFGFNKSCALVRMNLMEAHNG
jgi:hypothetical protein